MKMLKSTNMLYAQSYTYDCVFYNETDRLKIRPTISRIIQQFKSSISKQIGFSLCLKSFL